MPLFVAALAIFLLGGVLGEAAWKWLGSVIDQAFGTDLIPSTARSGGWVGGGVALLVAVLLAWFSVADTKNPRRRLRRARREFEGELNRRNPYDSGTREATNWESDHRLKLRFLKADVEQLSATVAALPRRRFK